MICVNRQATAHPMISTSSIFCVNILAREQVAIARRFADPALRNERFSGIATHVASTGAPVIDGALAFVDCELAEEQTAGTHTIFLGTVVASGFSEGEPLGYFNADYRVFDIHAV